MFYPAYGREKSRRHRGLWLAQMIWNQMTSRFRVSKAGGEVTPGHCEAETTDRVPSADGKNAWSLPREQVLTLRLITLIPLLPLSVCRCTLGLIVWWNVKEVLARASLAIVRCCQLTWWCSLNVTARRRQRVGLCHDCVSHPALRSSSAYRRVLRVDYICLKSLWILILDFLNFAPTWV